MKRFSIAVRIRAFILLLILSSAIIPTGWVLLSAYRNEVARTQSSLMTAGRVLSKQTAQSLLIGDIYNASRILSEVCDELKLVSCAIYDSSGAEIIHYPTVPATISKLSVYEQHLIYGGKSVGKLKFRYRSPGVLSLLDDKVGPIFGLLLVLLFLAALTAGRMIKKAFEDFQYLTRLTGEDGISGFVTALRKFDSPVKEVHTFVDQLQKYLGHVEDFEQAAHEKSKADALVRLSAQVAHDVRSPLAALEMVMSQTNKLPESERLLIRSAVSRIKDISNTLLTKTHETSNRSPVDALKTIELVSSLIELQLTEKRLEIRTRPNISIEGKLGFEAYGVFAEVQAAEFKRMISNLLNNAIEANENSGRVTVTLKSVNKFAEIEIADHGKGIHPEILARLGNRGETHGKAGGSGLGLWHARATVETWGGSLEIRSKVGEGTFVKLLLPRAATPHWFIPQIQINDATRIVVLDDDEAIHEIWRQRFRQANVPKDRLIHFSNSESLKTWMIEQGSTDCLYLMDFELIGSKETGLDLIESMRIGTQSILVTSRFEENGIRSRCKVAQTRLVPKGLAAFVPIQLEKKIDSASVVQNTKLDAVLIDDDPLVHLSWQMSASRAGKKLLVLDGTGDIEAILREVSLQTPIYVDCNLGNELRGETVIGRLFEKGYQELYLATGYSADEFESTIPGLRAVVGKEPPESLKVC